ncbi:B12-binding domain-containing radical SAM protein [Acetobacterium wieringae]|uniref:B12-binding domain-containing radical SAM protein n=1 Tax=Acetobacterium wieringae TaxID=52694 RepID=UPI002B2064F5|nr:radical SAM protein [Acetobacterium wieringae]MEA4807279.1 radical SAM protein [Acetobacterium wieringae]
MLRVLICAMNPANEGFFVPLIYGMLKSYSDQNTLLRENCHWLEPIMLPLSLIELEKAYNFSTLDVLGISCYQWNYTYQYELAQKVKAVNPDCTIIAGGPQVDWKDPDYFNKYPIIDFAVPAEGEAAFRDILLAKLQNWSTLNGIKGTLVNPELGMHGYIPALSLDLEKKPSPWLSMKDFWRRYFKKNAYYHLAAAIETSRGCPYTCSYCDWGSKTNLKVRKIPDAVAKAEIEFILGELKPWFMFWTDANLGILPRDKDLAAIFSKAKTNSGFPLWLYYNNNKNNWQTNLEIAKSFRGAGLLTKYVLSLQHLDKGVLTAIGRKNLPDDQLKKLIKELHRIDYPIFTQLITGCPGDTFEKWLDCFSELMEMGVHAEYRAYPFSLLPNSTAGSAEYQDYWSIEWIERPDFVAYYYLKDSSLNWALSSSRYVVGTSTYDREEYKKMWLLCWMIQAFHDHGITRLIAIALHKGRQMSYREFYGLLYIWFYRTIPMRFFSQRLIDHIDAWLTESEASFLKYNERLDGMAEPEEDLALHLMDYSDLFFRELKNLLKGICPDDLLDYQQNLLMKQNFSPETNAFVKLPNRWAEYFAEYEKNPFDFWGWPSDDDTKTNYQVDVTNLNFPVRNWYEIEDNQRRWKAYYDQIIQHNVPGRQRSIFKKIFFKNKL